MNKQLFKDINTNETLTTEDLQKEFDYLNKNNETEAETLKQYISNCLDKNGFLILI